MTNLLTSAQAAIRLGVGVSAVKRWADEGTLSCVRTAGGHRRFASAEIDRFRGQQLRPSQSDAWAPWLTAMLGPGNTYAVMALLCDARAKDGSWQVVMSRMGELLRLVGEQWERGELSVAQEHVASAALSRALALIAATLPVGGDAPRCLLASADGEVHTLGLSMTEVCLREVGWSPLWLGAPTATNHLLEYLRSGDVQMVALSASAWSSDAHALARQADTIGKVCRRARIPLVLGGRGAWPVEPAYGARLDGWEALQQVAQPVPTPAASQLTGPRGAEVRQ